MLKHKLSDNSKCKNTCYHCFIYIIKIIVTIVAISVPLQFMQDVCQLWLFPVFLILSPEGLMFRPGGHLNAGHSVFSSQVCLILILSTTKWWKFEWALSTLESNTRRAARQSNALTTMPLGFHNYKHTFYY